VEYWSTLQNKAPFAFYKVLRQHYSDYSGEVGEFIIF